MVTGVLGTLGILTAWFSFNFGKDFIEHKDDLPEHNSWLKVFLIGAVTNFFDTLGIGSFAPTTTLLRVFDQIKDKYIPGTLNVSCTIPVVLEAFIFISVIQVEVVTLISMLAAATIGAHIGAGIISNMDEKKIQGIMGGALLVTAFLMLAGQMNWMPVGGEAIGLTGIKLVVAVIGNFILGALMTAGVGLYAPCMALIYVLGMSPRVAFPIMMGSCAFLMPVASVKFVKEQAYDKKAAMGITLGGILGVFVAAYIVKTLPLRILTWLVIGVVTYTGITMLKSANEKKEALEEENVA